MKNSIKRSPRTELLFMILIFGWPALFSCTPDRAPSNPRKYVDDKSVLAADLQQKASSLPAYVDPIFVTNGLFANAETVRSLSACKTLQNLSASEASTPRFSIFKSLQIADAKLQGAVALTESPLAQYALAGQPLPENNEQFLALVEQRYKAKQISEQEYQMIQSVKANEGAVALLRFFTVNKQLQEVFPGIIEKPLEYNIGPIKLPLPVNLDVSKSLFMLLAKKGGFTQPTPDVLKILATGTPLLPASLRDFSSEFESTLRAAVAGLQSKSPTEETLCSLVLWQRVFAQMLKIKGYTSVQISETGFLPEVKAEAQALAKVDHPGLFFDVREKKPVLLTPEDLQNYNPAERFLQPVLGEASADSLHDTLSLLDAVISVHVATHPLMAEPKGYIAIFGDIKSLESKAFVPKDIHKLSLGFITLLFKNLAGANIVKVDAQGLPTQDEAKIAGALLLDKTSKKIQLENVLMMLRVSARLTQMVKKLPSTPDEIAKLTEQDAVYQPATLGLLQQTLLPSLEKLILPLALQAIKMVEGQQESGATPACINELTWNDSTGALTPSSVAHQCSPEILALYRQVMHDLGLAQRSPVLYQRGTVSK